MGLRSRTFGMQELCYNYPKNESTLYCYGLIHTPHKKKNIGTQGVQELFFCDLKAPGDSSTRLTLTSYDKGNSFTYTGPGFHSMSL